MPDSYTILRTSENQALGSNMVFVCNLFLKEANIHFDLICFDVILIIHTSM